MLFVPFSVPSYSATPQHQPNHPVASHQPHHPLQPPAGAQAQIITQQPGQLPQLNHLNHQGIVQSPTNQPTIHSSSCSPQQQATTPNKKEMNCKKPFNTALVTDKGFYFTSNVVLFG
ncbi:hypothetical protein QAD02_020175 [Eretmocerus hayati]|uniref:Uncharacterized protein n=1 Tax=Eretmocerus hayati TaxID=131215 RepID=A0ACC2PLR3_9HYME|nr:hypothetical protein QAD02_020175 [Eretmocerus hayati]